MRQLVILSVFSTTFLLPLIFIILFRIINKHYYTKRSASEMSFIYLFTAISYYSGYYFISQLPLAGFYKTGLLAGTLVLISLSLIALRWKISSYMAGAGTIAGITIAVMLRLGVYNLTFLSAVLLIGGLTGFSRLRLKKNTPLQVCTGYLLGFGILFLVFSYI